MRYSRMERTGYDDMRKGCKGIGCDWWDGNSRMGWDGLCVYTAEDSVFLTGLVYTHCSFNSSPSSGYRIRQQIRDTQESTQADKTRYRLYTIRKKSVKIEISVNICWWRGVKAIYRWQFYDIWHSFHPINKYSLNFEFCSFFITVAFFAINRFQVVSSMILFLWL